MDKTTTEALIVMHYECAVYCIQHRCTIIVHRIEMMGVLKLLESCLWKKIAYGGINPKRLDSKWKIPFRFEMDLNGLKQNVLCRNILPYI